jgi:hypothetical protein
MVAAGQLGTYTGGLETGDPTPTLVPSVGVMTTRIHLLKSLLVSA